MSNFVEELSWRGMLHDAMPGTNDQLAKEMTSAYVGIDPTADSLHIGHLVSIMMLKHFQNAGHRPLALIGGATGMIGDPSGKSKERNLLDEAALRHNQESIKKQLRLFLDFDNKAANAALLVNNYDWMRDFTFLDFIRDIGKHLTVNYMMAKDSVKKRLTGDGEGMSFTEFTYQLVQGYDFLHLYREFNCKIQMGGSDQWGNITTGTELIRRKESGEAFALTCPLITKADGGKFGKTEEGNIWLSSEYTSPYAFYQFWLNTSDGDAEKYIKIFTMLGQEEIAKLVAEHTEAPHQRALQRKLAEEVTTMVHGKKELDLAIKASDILFGKSTEDDLKNLGVRTLLEIFSGVPQFEVKKELLMEGMEIINLLAEETQVFSSKGEARKMLQANGVSLNKVKVNLEKKVTMADAIAEQYILAQKGKKNYFLIKVVQGEN
jgi:tyrosyl-tRNA synthetase